jgi:hypothetical protein
MTTGTRTSASRSPAPCSASPSSVCFGLDGFLHFLPHPTSPPPADAVTLAVAFATSGYTFPLAYRPLLTSIAARPFAAR